MKKIALLAFTTLLLVACASQNIGPNVNGNGYMADGYDVTEYFNDNATEGFDRYSTTYNGAKYKFVTKIIWTSLKLILRSTSRNITGIVLMQ